MTVDNTFSGKLRQDREGRLLSTKHRGSGMGTESVKMIAEKYHGAMELRTDGEKFTLSVLLIIPQQSESISQQVC